MFCQRIDFCLKYISYLKEEALSTNGFEDKGMNGWMVKALPSFEVSSFIFLACLATCFVGKKYLVDLV